MKAARGFAIALRGQWVKGKSFPSSCPVGPYLVTADEIGDPQSIALWLEVDSVRRQDGNTSSMIFPVAEIVSYLSRFALLEPGDLIISGTLAGVGAGFKPPIFLGLDALVTLGGTGLGSQRQRVQLSNSIELGVSLS